MPKWAICSTFLKRVELPKKVYSYAHCRDYCKSLLKHTWNFTFFLGMLSKVRICSRMLRTLGLMLGFFITSWIFWMKKNRIESGKQHKDQKAHVRCASLKHTGLKSASTHSWYSLLIGSVQKTWEKHLWFYHSLLDLSKFST